MESLLERASRVLSAHPAPALPLPELRRLVRGSGVAVGEEALLAVLARGPERFRVVDPWRGPWTALRPGSPHRRARAARAGVHRGSRRRPGGAGPGSAGSGAHADGAEAAGPVLPGLGHRWVVQRPGARSRPPDEGAILGRLRHTLAHLGWTVDGGSPRDLTRWCRLVRESRRIRQRVTAKRAAPVSPG